MKKIIFILLISLVGISPAQALGGDGATDATGDPKVVALIYGGENWQRGCSGAAIAPRIVLTAAHCAYGEIDGRWSYGKPDDKKIYGSLTADQKFWVSKPGVLVPFGGTKEKVKVIAQFPSKKYERGYADGERGPGTKGRPLIFDFAVLVLESPITEETYRIATLEEVSYLRQSQSEVLSIGYGLKSYQEYMNASKVGSFPNPSKATATMVRDILYQRNSPSEIGTSENTMIQIKYPKNTYAGGGDSGSPLWFNKNGEWVYIGASCCGLGIVAQTNPNGPEYSSPFLLGITGAEYHSAFAFPELFQDAKDFLAKEQEKEKEVTAVQPIAPTVVAEEQKQEVIKESTETTKEIQKIITVKCNKNKKTITVISKNKKCPKGWKVVK